MFTNKLGRALVFASASTLTAVTVRTWAVTSATGGLVWLSGTRPIRLAFPRAHFVRTA